MKNTVCYPLNIGNVVRLVTASGVGYGEPLKRSAEKVAQNVNNGYISVQSANDKFGVLVNADTFAVEGFTKPREQKGK